MWIIFCNFADVFGRGCRVLSERPMQFLYKTISMTKRVLFINQEIAPYVPNTEMSLQGRDIPHKMQEGGYEIRTFMPKWGIINERRGQLHEVIRLSGMNIIIDDTDHPLLIKVASIPQTRLQVYFIDNDDYFMKRQMALDTNGEEYQDNGERAIFFARGVLETVKKLRWIPDVIHCQGWMSYVVPIYIKSAYKDDPAFENAKVVTSVFKDELKAFKDVNFKSNIEFLGVDAPKLEAYKDEFDFEELGKMAIDYSDGIIEAEASANDTLIERALSAEKNVLRYAEGDRTAAYKDFYESILGK